jgi:hypothetical protein
LPSALDTALHITTFGVDGAGELYVMGHDGSLWHLVQD